MILNEASMMAGIFKEPGKDAACCVLRKDSGVEIQITPNEAGSFDIVFMSNGSPAAVVLTKEGGAGGDFSGKVQLPVSQNWSDEERRKETWTDEKVVEYLNTLSFESKLKLLYFSGSVMDALGLLQAAMARIAETAIDDLEAPTCYVLTEADHAMIVQAAAHLLGVSEGVAHRATIFTQEIMKEHSEIEKGGE